MDLAPAMEGQVGALGTYKGQPLHPLCMIYDDTLSTKWESKVGQKLALFCTA